jgi:hypothetical protein
MNCIASVYAGELVCSSSRCLSWSLGPVCERQRDRERERERERGWEGGRERVCVSESACVCVCVCVCVRACVGFRP